MAVCRALRDSPGSNTAYPQKGGLQTFFQLWTELMLISSWSRGLWQSLWHTPPAIAGGANVTERRKPGLVLFAVWSLLVAAGSGALSLYEFHGRNPALATDRWPDNSVLSLDGTRPALVFFMHPRCPCTAASLAELDRVLSQQGDRFHAYAVVTVPPGADPRWEEGRNLDAARRLPNTTLIFDRGGALARRFGAVDSGTLLVFASGGSRLFAGGITASRGHEGESTGSEALLAIAAGDSPLQTESPVFGCSLLGDSPLVGNAQ